MPRGYPKCGRLPLAERFAAKVDRNGPVPPHKPELGPCHVWTDRDGKPLRAGRYGTLNVDGVDRKASHVAFYLADGRWPVPGCLHHCDHTPCVRRGHLFEGDQRANMCDARDKGRLRGNGPGAANGNAKVTWEQVCEIRARYAAGGVTQVQLAAEYGLKQPHISELIRRVNRQNS